MSRHQNRPPGKKMAVLKAPAKIAKICVEQPVSVPVWVRPQPGYYGPPMPQARSAAVAGIVGGSLVVAGGEFGVGGILASAVAYRPTTGWTALPPMPHAAWRATACVLRVGHPCCEYTVLESNFSSPERTSRVGAAGDV